MKTVFIEEFVIYGLSTRTCNANEMDAKTAKIGQLWQDFTKQVEVDFKNGERAYGVYYNYKSDANGDFNVLAGTSKSHLNLEQVTIQKGRYLVFENQATSANDMARVQAVIQTWGQIWQYFADGHTGYKRTFTTDFEHYKNPTVIAIYIAIEAE